MDSSVKTAPDHYAMLGLSPDASDTDVEQAFHARVREHLQHSDLSDAPRRQQARQVSLAYETLRDPEKRSAYDASRETAAHDDVPSHPAAADFGSDNPILFVPPSARRRRVREEPAPPVVPAAVPLVPEAEDLHPQAEPSATPLGARDAEEPTAPTPHEPPASEFDEAGLEHEAEPALEPEPVTDPEQAANTHPRWDIIQRGPVDHVPAHSMYYEEPRPSGVHRAALGAGAVVIALGVLGLLMTRGGSSGNADHRPATTSTPATTAPATTAPTGSAPAGQASPGTSGSLASPANRAAPATTVSTQLAQSPALRPIAPIVPRPSTDRLASLKIPPAAAAPASSPAAGSATPTNTGTTASGGAPASVGAAPANSTASAAAAAASSPAPAAAPPARRGTFAHWISGGLSNADNPGGMYQGTVTVRFTVGPNGRVSECRPVASSGNGGLDASTCSLVQQRLRFTPAQDADGHPVSSEVRTTYSWGRTRRH